MKGKKATSVTQVTDGCGLDRLAEMRSGQTQHLSCKWRQRYIWMDWIRGGGEKEKLGLQHL